MIRQLSLKKKDKYYKYFDCYSTFDKYKFYRHEILQYYTLAPLNDYFDQS